MKSSISNNVAEVSLPLLLTAYMKTIRFRIKGEDKRNKRAIFIFWHKNMLAGWNLFKGMRFLALVSQSKDGQILNNILLKWKYDVIRGSSSKGGKEALEQIVDVIGEKSIVLTPDGPRGPSMEIKNGALILSHKTGLPIIPVKISYDRKKILDKSWDKFEIPLPFSTCDVTFGDEWNYKEYLYDDKLVDFKKSLKLQM
jgi:lysophospholipid acyltransferase (LPLAT)-like uncharacterized protein